MTGTPLVLHERPWGSFVVVYEGADYWTKVLKINPGQSLSLQYHERREEVWMPVSGRLRARINGESVDLRPGVRYDVSANVIHRITNEGTRVGYLIEVATGAPDETDIIRLHDNYGR